MLDASQRLVLAFTLRYQSVSKWLLDFKLNTGKSESMSEAEVLRKYLSEQVPVTRRRIYEL